MYEIFQQRCLENNSLVHNPEFEYVKRTYQLEVANVVDYYHSRVFAVKSNHLLCRILTILDIPFQYSSERYVEVARARAPYVANGLKLTSELSPGQIFEGVFYGPGCKEIILSEDEYFSPFEVERDWKNVSPVRVITHPKSDLGLLLPNGRPTSTDTGLAVISVNLPLLAMQFRCFLKEQMSKMDTTSMLGPAHFVHMYVLPNMLYSHLDYVVVNRIMKLYYGAPMGVAKMKHPFPVKDYSGRMDRVLSTVIDISGNKKMKYEWVLKAIPSIVSTDTQEALLLPDITPTRQVNWATMLSRLEVTQFLIDMGGETDMALCRTELNSLGRYLKRIERENVLGTILSGDMLYDTQQCIKDILTTIDYR